jgi:hypothetical protein
MQKKKQKKSGKRPKKMLKRQKQMLKHPSNRRPGIPFYPLKKRSGAFSTGC